MKKTLVFMLVLSMVVSLIPAALVSAETFPDMPDNWSTTAIQFALDNGLIKGMDGMIMPQNNLTRAQMATIMARVLGATVKAPLDEFSDVSSDAWYADDMAKAVQMRLFRGSEGYLNPEANITRQEVFTVLARAFMLTNGSSADVTKFSDYSEIHPTMLPTVAAIVRAGYAKGNYGQIHPTDNITRAEFAQLVYNMVTQFVTAEGAVTTLPDGNIIVNVPGVSLEGLTIRGDLIIGEGVGNGEVSLKNTTIEGRLVVRGGGPSSGIKLMGSTKINSLCSARTDDRAWYFIEPSSIITNFDVYATSTSGTVIQGNPGTVNILGEDCYIVFVASTTKNVNVTGSGAIIESDSSATLGTATINKEANNTIIKGGGMLTTLKIYGNNTSLEQIVGVNTTVDASVTGTKILGKEVAGGQSGYSLKNGGLGNVKPTTTGGGGGGYSPPSDIAEVTKLAFNITKATIPVGGTVTIVGTVSPPDAYSKTVTWATSNKDIATVAASSPTSTGIVTGVAVGQVTITGTARNDKKDTCIIDVVTETNLTDITKLQETIDNTTGRTIINLPAGGPYTLPAQIMANKNVVIKGAVEGTTIHVTGTTPAFALSNGAALEGLTIVKTDDNVNQDIITMDSDTSVMKCTISALYADGDTEMVRGIKQLKDSTNTVIMGNTFGTLTQPAYIEGTSAITGNKINGTQGLQLCVDHVSTVTGNTFTNNSHDVVIIANGKPEGNQALADNYDGKEVNTMSTTNSNCKVENLYTGYNSGDGVDSISKLQAAIDAAAPGATITILPGTYLVTSTINVNKNVTVKALSGTFINTTGSSPAFSLSNGGILDGPAITKTDNIAQDIVVMGTNTSVLNTSIESKYVGSQTDSTKGIKQTAGSTNITITRSSFWKLATPVYLEGTGNFSNNSINESGNIVACVDYPHTIAANSFKNRKKTYDILVSANGKAEGNSTYESNFSVAKMDALTINNNDAKVFNEYTNYVPTESGINNIAQLQAAIDAAAPGTSIRLLAGTYTLTTPITINKDVTLLGQNGAIINVTGTTPSFVLSNGASMDNLTIRKTDDAVNQDIITMDTNTAVRNCDIAGLYNDGEPEMTRAIAQVEGSTDIIVSNNSFAHLNEPVLARGTGSVTNNTVTYSNGFKAAVQYITVFTGNTFGNNSRDITIITNNALPGIPVYTDNYSNPAITQMSITNNGAIVKNEYTNYPPEVQGISDINELQAAIDEAPAGTTITLLAGSYTLSTTINVNKNVTVKGQTGAIIHTTGDQPAFILTNSGSINGLTIIKDDKVAQDIVQASANSKVNGCTIKGQFATGDTAIVCGVRVMPGEANVSMVGNTFDKLSQSAYVEGTGKFNNNIVTNCSGLVVCVDYLVEILGNKFTNCQSDITIIPNGHEPNIELYVDNYSNTKIDSISQANSCFIDNQYTGYTSFMGGKVLRSINELQAAIDAAPNGSTISIPPGDHTIASPPIRVYKNITVTAADGAIIHTSGTSSSFVLSDGGKLDGLVFDKFDKSAQDIIQMGAGTTVTNCKFTGRYLAGETQLSRAIYVADGENNTTITNNSIAQLNQAMFVGGTSYVTGNDISGTNGIILCVNHVVSPSGNSFLSNTIDITIIANNQPSGIQSLKDNYSMAIMTQISNANNGCSMKNTYTSDVIEAQPTLVTDITKLQQIINMSSPGDTIRLDAKDHILTSPITLGKAVTILGLEGAKVYVSGSATSFSVSGGGIIDNVDIIKTDKTTQDIISAGSNATFKNCQIVGIYNSADVEISRGIRQQAGSVGLTVSNCIFNRLREPIYVEGTGVISDSTFGNSTGIQVCVNTLVTFSNNTFTDNAPYDIHVLINNMPAQDNVLLNNYSKTKMATISQSNHGALIYNDYLDYDPNKVIVTDISKLQEAINAAEPGKTIYLAQGTHWLPMSTIQIDKPVTVKGMPGAIIKTYGTASAFNLIDGGAIDSLTIMKEDRESNQNLIMMGNNASVTNCTFSGKYVSGDSWVSRAIVQYAGSEDILIQGNSFDRLRQPAYLEGTGSAVNNYVSNTRGFVVCVNHAFNFSGNTFSGNAVDIAIIENGMPANVPEYLDNFSIAKVFTMVEDNHNAVIENQYIGYNTKVGVNNLDNLQDVINAAPEGHVITVAAGTYYYSGSPIYVNKPITVKAEAGLLIQASGSDPIFIVFDGGILDGFQIQKTNDDADQNLLQIANNGTIQNCDLSALYDFGDSEMTRGIIQYRGSKNSKILNNTFNKLTQAMRTEGTGMVEGNHISATGGIEISVDYVTTFRGNSFTQNTDDFKIVANGNLPGNPDFMDNYSETVMAAMKSDNNNANVVNEYLKNSSLIDVYDISTLQTIINTAPAGSVITIKGGNHYLAETIEVNRNVTIKGEANTVIRVAESNIIFNLSNGAVLHALTIEKIDDKEQNIIYMNTGTTVRRCTITGKYTSESTTMTRGILQAPGATGIMVSDTTFRNLNQPAYFEGTGIVQDCTIENTSGMIVGVAYVMTIANNRFTNNAKDITIVRAAAPLNDPQCKTNYDIFRVDMISDANYECYVENTYIGYIAHQGLTSINQLQQVIDSADHNATIIVAAGDHYLSTTINVNKHITVKAMPGATIHVAGTETSFNLTDGAILDGFKIIKDDDNTNQNIIVMGESTTVKNCDISGKYVLGDEEVTRGIVTIAGATGLLIDNNKFTGLRQPAYIEGTGRTVNNTAIGTRGFVTCVNYFMDFTGNEFSSNYLDIVIIPNGMPANVQEYLDNYSPTIIDIFKTANSNCKIENQYLTYEDSTPVTDMSQLQTFIDNAAPGSVLTIPSGNYFILPGTTYNVDKNVKIKGEGSTLSFTGTAPLFNLSSGATLENLSFVKLEDNVSQNILTVAGDDVTIKGCTFSAQYVLGDQEVTRGLVLNAGTSNLVLDGNTFTGLRQPAYLEGTGTVTNNTVSGTRGFVVCSNYYINFTGNIFSNNAVDIAIIANGQEGNPDAIANYSNQEVDRMATDNGTAAMVENQLTGYSRNVQ